MFKLPRQQQAGIVRAWIDRTLELFPEETRKFLVTTKDPFANPMGTTIAAELEALFDCIVREAPRDEVAPHLDRITKITCIQENVPPSRAVAFVFALKDVIRSELPDTARDMESWLGFESRVDELAQWTFDSYCAHREQLSTLKVREAQRKVSTLMRMAKVSGDEPPVGDRPLGGCSQ